MLKESYYLVSILFIGFVLNIKFQTPTMNIRESHFIPSHFNIHFNSKSFKSYWNSNTPSKQFKIYLIINIPKFRKFWDVTSTAATAKVEYAMASPSPSSNPL